MADYLTVVIRLPVSRDDRRQISEALKLGGTFHGGEVTALSLEDEITVVELLEEKCDPSDVAEARERVKGLHAAAEAA